MMFIVAIEWNCKWKVELWKLILECSQKGERKQRPSHAPALYTSQISIPTLFSVCCKICFQLLEICDLLG